MEIWKKVPNFNDYEVSDLGRVKSLKFNKQKILKPIKMGNYKGVCLSKNSKVNKFYVHRLVMLVFVGKSKLEVNHINTKTDDNRLKNLEYCTPKQNMLHANKMGKVDKGEKCNLSKLKEIEAIEIINYLKTKEFTCNQIAIMYNISVGTIYCINKGKTWKHLKR